MGNRKKRQAETNTSASTNDTEKAAHRSAEQDNNAFKTSIPNDQGTEVKADLSAKDANKVARADTGKSTKKKSEHAAGKAKIWIFAACLAVVLVVAAVGLASAYNQRVAARNSDAAASNENVAVYKEKLALLADSVLTEDIEQAIGKNAAGDRAGQAVFLSVCDGTQRARVFTGTGRDLQSAWDAADAKATEYVLANDIEPIWLKADVVCESATVSYDLVAKAIAGSSEEEFFREGVAFDPSFETALLEAELNGAKIFDYENGGFSGENLNYYLEEMDRETFEVWPEEVRIFRCMGWLCDDADTVYPLSSEGLDYGRRTQTVDGEYAKELVLNASAFLEQQVREDGTFVYGIYPRFDSNMDDYNIIRHASAISALICRYRLDPKETLAEKIDKTIEYMLSQIRYDPEGRAYLYDEEADEIKLGANSMAIVALTEYMDAFDTDTYQTTCEALGYGILSMMDPIEGTYYHVLNGDFTRKEKYRTIYYDGEATYALCCLYTLTDNPAWLHVAETAVQHFIDAGYTAYKDHWVAYTMNEITKYIPDNQEYYDFALANAQYNLEDIRDCETASPTYLELLMATFEVYNRMIENGVDPTDFDLSAFVDTISRRANQQLNDYFYPEYAMYMENPQRILDTFMARQEGYRVRIDDVQHNVDAYSLYAKNYDKLLEHSLPATMPSE